MVGARGRAGRLAARPLVVGALLAGTLLALPVPAPVGGDVIFHVPEVLVRHAAVGRAVGSGTAPPRANDSEAWPAGTQQRYEYFVEHAVSTPDAKKMAIMLKLSDMVEPIPGCGVCTKRDLEYCETKVVADHCCCERRYVAEPFPWLPHTCYIGPERCTPLASNCAHYARLRDCCCTRKLAEHWKGILSRSPRMSVTGISLLVLSAVLFTIYL